MTNSQFKTLEEIHNSFGRKDRYQYAKVLKGDEVRFQKTGIADDSPENLCRELIWADFMSYVALHFPGLNARAPQGAELVGDNQLIMEYIDLPLLADPGRGKDWARHIDRFADMLIALDKASESYRIPEELRKFKPRSAEESLRWWVRDLELTDDMKQAIEYVKGAQEGLARRMQHGDLTAWQIFDNGDEWIVYDGERSGDDLPRFNDLAYAAGRLAIRCGEPKAADKMIARFLAHSGLDAQEFYYQFKPVFLLRLIGMVADGMRDSNANELGAAQKLLRRTLAETDPKRYLVTAITP